jgi:hypothetical protein
MQKNVSDRHHRGLIGLVGFYEINKIVMFGLDNLDFHKGGTVGSPIQCRF